MWTCLACGTSNDDTDGFCVKCGAHVPVFPGNHCTNRECTDYKVKLKPEQKRCGKCGSLTVIGKEIEKYS